VLSDISATTGELDLLMLGNERQHGAIELIGRFPPDGVPHIWEHHKLGALDAIRDLAHEGGGA
jgi:hypothetical protein